MSEEPKVPAEVANPDKKAGNASGESPTEPVKMRKTKRTKACFNCGKPVAPEDRACPHCKATGATSKVNTGAYMRIALGFFIGVVLWAIFWR